MEGVPTLKLIAIEHSKIFTAMIDVAQELACVCLFSAISVSLLTTLEDEPKDYEHGGKEPVEDALEDDLCCVVSVVVARGTD